VAPRAPRLQIAKLAIPSKRNLNRKNQGKLKEEEMQEEETEEAQLEVAILYLARLHNTYGSLCPADRFLRMASAHPRMVALLA